METIQWYSRRLTAAPLSVFIYNILVRSHASREVSRWIQLPIQLGSWTCTAGSWLIKSSCETLQTSALADLKGELIAPASRRLSGSWLWVAKASVMESSRRNPSLNTGWPLRLYMKMWSHNCTAGRSHRPNLQTSWKRNGVRVSKRGSDDGARAPYCPSSAID